MSASTEKMEVDDDETMDVGTVKFQKETKYNKFLPYYDKIAKEADEQLAAIKTGLGHSLLMREMRPALLHWACELDKYIYLHGRRFTKDEHITFVNIFYELICMPGLELRLVKTFCHILTNLLQKSELLSRDDLQLAWRPLYDIYVYVAYKNLEEDGLLLLPKDMAKSLEALIKHARKYFSLESTKEIITELRPLMCPWDMSFVRAICCLTLFLPTDLPPEHHDKGYKLWLEEIVGWWLQVQNCPPWESKVIHLLSRLTLDNIGYVDWNDKMPDLFTKLLRSFGLAVSDRGGEKIEIGLNGKLVEAEVAAVWIASMMGGTSNVQQFITQMLTALESYVHPSNFGKWQNNILNFVQRLALAVCQRVHRERHRAPDWRNAVPNDWKLTDKQIDEFVSSLLPSALNGMFAKMRADLAVNCLRYLSHLSPNLVIPAVLEKLYPALETLIEPHRLTQSMNSLVAVILPMIRSSGEGACRSHVIPLMLGVLPGLDPNDVNKSMLTLQVLSMFSVLVPIADCSDAILSRNDLTQEEKELCSATASFESYVNQFMDKVFAIVENVGSAGGAGHISRRRDSIVKFTLEENLMKSGMYAAFRALLSNCSSEIYQVAVDRLFAFVSDNVLEGRVTAEMLGELCFSAVRTAPHKSFKRFLQFFIKRLKALITEDIINDDEVDINISWYLTMCIQVVRCDGDVLLAYKDDILELLNLITPMKSKEIYMSVSQLIEHLLMSLSFIYVCEYEKDRDILDQPLNEYLPIRHWADACVVKKMQIKFHVPTVEELEFIKQIHKIYVLQQLKLLENPKDLTKDDMIKSLSFIKACVNGSASVLPLLDGDIISVIDSSVQFSKFTYITDPNNLALDYDGKNARNFLFEKLHDLMEFLLNARENETKVLVLICSIFNTLLFHRGLQKAKYDAQSRGFSLSKMMIADKVLGKKSFIKSLVTEMALLQHHKRLLEKSGYYFTSSHLAIAYDLLKLSTSQYSEVRREAQSALDQCMNSFPYSYRLLLDSILEYLKEDTKISHEQFKGALYVLLGTKSRSLLTRHHWNSLVKIWPAVIKAQHSEKPSIIKLLEDFQNTIVESIESFQIKFTFTEKPLQLAKELWRSDSTYSATISPSESFPKQEKLTEAIKQETKSNDENERDYYTLIQSLVDLSSDANLHWRHLDMAQSFLSLLIRLDMRFPANAVNVFVRLLVHDSLKTRRMAVGLFAAVLKIHAIKSKKISLNISELMKQVTPGGSTRDTLVLATDPYPIKWGFRKDNDWLIYHSDRLPKSDEDWNGAIFSEKTHHGFYCWPRTFTISAPIKDQLKATRTREELNSDELALYDAMLDPKYVEKLCRLMSLEEKKEEDHFHSTNFLFFKGLFRTYGDTFVDGFKELIEKYVASMKESEQRMAAEFVAGLIAGAKMWPGELQTKLWSWLVPLLRTAFDNVTTETYRDWGTCVATVFDSRDPRKLHWLIGILIELAEKPMDASFNAASRYFLLQGGINQQQWRIIEVWHHLLKIVQPQLEQPYQNLRDRLGSVLATIFWFDLQNILLESELKPPNLAEFLNGINAKLKVLWNEVELGHPDSAVISLENPQRKAAILLLKTMLCFFNSRWSHAFESAPRCMLQFLPLLCYFENETSDDELKRDAHWQLMQGAARALLVPNVIDDVLQICAQVAKNKWWKSRVSILQYLQVSLFSNLFFYSTAERKSCVQSIVLMLIKDERLEVRESASEVLGSLLHCSYFSVENKVLTVFQEWTRSKDLVARHAGVLGLAAIVKSCPYSVPEFLPEVLMLLCPHATARPPIGSTVKKTLSDFKRTHHDCWHEHKECFTDDQLCVLTDLLVSPTYYV